METTIGIYASVVKAHIPFYFRHDAPMTFDIKQTLAENLVRLMHHDDAHPITQAELARRSKVDQRYIGRLQNAEFNASVKVLEKLATAFDLQPWQILVPGLDPGNPPVNHVTEAEKRLYERLKEAARMVMDSDPPNKYG